MGALLMPRGKEGRNPEVAEIVQKVLGSLSLELTAEKLNYRLTRTPISDLKKGKIGREETVRTFAEGFAGRICEEYGEVVSERFGECNEQTVSDWLAEKAGFGLRYAARPADRVRDGGELTYEPDLEGISLEGFRGVDGLPPEAIRDLEEDLKALIAARRRRFGIE